MPSEWESSLPAVRQRQDLDTRWIAGVAGGTAVLLALSLWGIWFFYAAGGKLADHPPRRGRNDAPLWARARVRGEDGLDLGAVTLPGQ